MNSHSPYKIIRRSEYQRMPWKNGLGSTEQIFIYPPDSQFAKSEFDFRLSMANLKCNSPFSPFVGYQRLLSVIDGHGLLIHNKVTQKITQGELYTFDGSSQIQAELIDGEVYDFGLIWNPLKFSIEAYTHNFTNNGPLYFTQSQDIPFIFVFLIEGKLRLDGELIMEKETLIISNEMSFPLRCEETHTTTKAIVVRLRQS